MLDVKTLALARKGGSGGMPDGGEPNKQLVTDGDGNAKWEDRLAYGPEYEYICTPSMLKNGILNGNDEACLVKVSDDILTKEQLLGAEYEMVEKEGFRRTMTITNGEINEFPLGIIVTLPDSSHPTIFVITHNNDAGVPTGLFFNCRNVEALYISYLRKGPAKTLDQQLLPPSLRTLHIVTGRIYNGHVTLYNTYDEIMDMMLESPVQLRLYNEDRSSSYAYYMPKLFSIGGSAVFCGLFDGELETITIQSDGSINLEKQQLFDGSPT